MKILPCIISTFFLFIWIGLILDVIFYSKLPRSFRLKFKWYIRYLPLSGLYFLYVFFYKNNQ
jgi:amino acid transporter